MFSFYLTTAKMLKIKRCILGVFRMQFSHDKSLTRIQRTFEIQRAIGLYSEKCEFNLPHNTFVY